MTTIEDSNKIKITNIETVHIFITALIIIIGIPLFCYLYKKRRIFPYNNATPFWTLVIIFLSILIQILNLCTCLFIPKESQYHFVIMRKITIYLVNMALFIAVLARLYSIKCCIEFNYNKLSTQFSRQSLNKKMFSRTIYSRKFLHFKRFLIIYVLYAISFFIYFAIVHELRNGQKCLDLFIELFYYPQNINQYDLLNFIDMSIPYVIYTIAFICMIYFVAQIMKYPFKKDKFKFKQEIFSLSIFMYMFFNIKVVFIMFFGNKLVDTIYLIDSVLLLCIILMYCFITIRRYSNFENIKVDDILNDFDTFTSRDITFKLFKTYVLDNFPQHFTYLSFLFDYFSYREIIKKLTNERKKFEQHKITNKSIKEVELELAKKGKEIYQSYFSNIDLSRNVSNSLVIDSKVEKTDTGEVVTMDIPFPIDIYEKVKDMYNSSFSQENVETVYDEPFAWVNQELLKDFEQFRKERDEKERLERIMFFVTIFEFK